MINKIRLRKDFINIQNNGNKNVCSSFIIQSYKNNSKRRMRELVYSLKDRFKEFGYDYVLIARKNIVDKKFEDLKKDLNNTLKKMFP